MRRVVVTGYGLVSPLGSDPEAMWRSVLNKENAVVTMPEFAEIGDLETRIGAPVRGFVPDRIPRKIRRSMSRMSQYATAATTDALAAARFPMEELAGGRVAIAAGSTTGSTDAMDEFWREFIATKSIRGIQSTAFLKVMSHTVSSHLALAFGVTGPVHAPCCACAVSNQAVGVGLDLIRLNRADAVIAGGADELGVLAAATFDVVRAGCRGWGDSPTLRPAPFDRTRDGVVCAEGSAIVILEERERAIARGAPILCEILGYGESCDANHMSTPEPTGMRNAILRALEDAKLPASAVDYICAHATGTVLGDQAEAAATFDIFGGNVPVASLKGNFGHMLAACGTTELIACILGMRDGIVPPTTNLVDPDVAPILLPTRPLQREQRVIMSNNFAFGGINASLVIGRG
jgi:3-oxoacyl-[acyl-carrier-protein] synthase II